MLSPVSRPDGRIRPATAQDLGRIAEIVAAAYAMYSDRMDRPPAPVLRDHGDFVRSGRAGVLGDPVVGFICLTARELSLLVEDVAVHPSAQRAGRGRQMMEFAEMWRPALRLCARRPLGRTRHRRTGRPDADPPRDSLGRRSHQGVVQRVQPSKIATPFMGWRRHPLGVDQMVADRRAVANRSTRSSCPAQWSR